MANIFTLGDNFKNVTFTWKENETAVTLWQINPQCQLPETWPVTNMVHSFVLMIYCSTVVLKTA
ncbi:hypothetical protein EXN66_Car011925 [Channa argus]|uniref:Uncharacterized protein n=1 Tax=Channa argus TaxID=215402 RepID=A0A6G1Q1A4_CHAAH|nr:hypothetical protein EXN66_Car011925 [Channa argus]